MGSVLSSVGSAIGGAASSVLGSTPWGAAASGLAGGLLGRATAGGGGDGDLRQSGGSAMDPATQARQLHLWNQAQQYARTNPFSQQYGGASTMPGMGAMSQAGQRYMTDAILGPGKYQSQNLGFTGYQRPTEAAKSSFAYQPDYEAAQTRTAVPPATTTSPWIPDPNRVSSDPPVDDPYYEADLYNRTPRPGDADTSLVTAEQLAAYNAEQERYANQQAAVGGISPIPTVGTTDNSPYAIAQRQKAAAAAAAPYTPAVPDTDEIIGEGEGRFGGIGGLGGFRPSRGRGDRVSAMPFMPRPDPRRADPGRVTTMPFFPPEEDEEEFAVGPQAPRPSPFRPPPPPIERDPYAGTGGPGLAPPPPPRIPDWRDEELGEDFDETVSPFDDGPPIIRPQAVGRFDAPQAIRAPVRAGLLGPGDEGRSPTVVREQQMMERARTMKPLPDLPSVGRFDAPQAIRAPVRAGLLGPGDEGRSPTVGIGEMEMGSLATRRMLEEAAPETPDFTSITAPTIGETTVGDVADIGAIGQVTTPEGFDVGAVDPTAIAQTTFTTPADIAAQTIGAPTAFDLGDVTAPELAGVGGAEVERITGRDIAGPAGVTIDPVTGQVTQGVGAVTPGMIAGPGGVTVDPVTGQTTQAVGGVAPGEFGGASFLGGPAIEDYMNQAGVEAQIGQAQEDYLREQNRLQADQAQAQAWGSRGQLPGEAASEAQQRNLAAIRGAGFDRAAQMMESDIGRQQEAEIQGRQLRTQTGLAGQALEAQRRESDATRAQQAALSGRELQTRADLEQRQLAQAAATRQAELGVQTGLAGQTLEAQRREADAARAQQAALAGQQWSAQTEMQTQELRQRAAIEGAQNALTAAQSNQQAVMQSGTQQQQLEAARQTEEARLGLSAAQGTQQLEAETGIRTQGFETQVAVENAQNALSASQSNLTAAMQSGDRQAQINAQRQMRDAELSVQTAMQTQQLRAEEDRYTQQAQTQVAMQNAQNEIRIAEQNMQSALQTGNQQAAIDAQRQMGQAEMKLDAAARNQAAGLQASELGLEAQQAFRQQQIMNANQLANIGALTQGATFGAGQQLQAMGAQQEAAQRRQQAWDYDQWLRGQQGGAQELALAQSFLPGGMQQQFERKPSRWGQIGGGLLGAAGVGLDIYDRYRNWGDFDPQTGEPRG